MSAKKAKKTQRLPAEKPPGDETGASGETTADERFLTDLQVRGEAQRPDSAGKLPLGATHAITDENADGTAKEAKRVRYKAF